MPRDEYSSQRMGQSWCDLGERARDEFKEVFAGTKTIAQCKERKRADIERFQKNLEEYAGNEDITECFAEIQAKASRIDAAHQAKYRT